MNEHTHILEDGTVVTHSHHDHHVMELYEALIPGFVKAFGEKRPGSGRSFAEIRVAIEQKAIYNGPVGYEIFSLSVGAYKTGGRTRPSRMEREKPHESWKRRKES